MTSEELRLRLAARALIEWRTPHTSPLFGNILRDLIRVSAIAKQLQIREDSKVLKYDQQGVILWCLSEAIDADESPIPALDMDRVSKYWATQRLKRVLSDYSRMGVVDMELWRGGPMRSQVASAIVSGIKKNKYSAWKALFAITVGLNKQECKRHIEELIRDEQIKFGRIQKLSRRLQRLYVLSLDANRAAIAASLLAVFIAINLKIFDIGRLGSFARLINSIALVSVFVAASSRIFAEVLAKGTLSDAYLNLLKRTRKSFLNITKAPLIQLKKWFKVRRLPDGSFAYREKRVSPIGFGLALIVSFASLRQFVKVKMYRHIDDVRRLRIKKRYKKRGKFAVEMIEFSQNELWASFRRFCHNEVELWRVLPTQQFFWLDCALDNAKDANSAVVRTVLSQVRSPEISWEVRIPLLQWLFSVEIRDH